VEVEGKTCLDVGASTGGFTDCLLQAGAKEVYAVDVGYGLLDYALRRDPRVKVLERTNFRFMEPSVIPVKSDLATVDVSFISLDKILPHLKEVLSPNADVVVLVKPQFEGTPKEVPGGFVKDETVRQEILARVDILVDKAGFTIRKRADSSVKGRKGNQETFLHLKRKTSVI